MQTAPRAPQLVSAFLDRRSEGQLLTAFWLVCENRSRKEHNDAMGKKGKPDEMIQVPWPELETQTEAGEAFVLPVAAVFEERSDQ